MNRRAVGDAVWLAAHAHRRTVGLCSAWGVRLHLVMPGRRGTWIWVPRILAAIVVMVRSRPRLLLVANPSLTLSTIACLGRRLLRYRLVIDAHNEGVRPFDRTGTLVKRLTRYVLRTADATIVTNESLAGDVAAAGGRPLVLTDPLPDVPSLPELTAVSREPEFVVIATFRSDEPIDEIMRAARELPDVRFSVTGDYSRYTGIVPQNVTLTGYLSDDDYWQLLGRADVVCDLTLKPDCLVCGAYEALALAKPMVLSADPSTRAVFGPAAILTETHAVAICAAVRQALASRSALADAAVQLRATYLREWQRSGELIWRTMETIASGAEKGGRA